MSVRIRFMMFPALAASLCLGQPPATAPTRPPDTQSAAHDQDEQDITALIEQLASPDYAQRERATELLKSKDLKLVEQIKGLYPAIDNHEVRLRLRDVAEHLFYRPAIDNLGGFLGISLDAVGNQEDRHLGPTEVAIRVVEVLPSTAAAQAGLETGDLIMGVEGHELSLSRGDPSEFVNLISSMTPGSQVDLVIQRDSQRFVAHVKLGKKTLQTIRRLRLRPEDREALDQADQAFHIWWREIAESD